MMYRCFGLDFRSSRRLAELGDPYPARSDNPIELRWGITSDVRVQSIAEGRFYQAKPGEFLISIPKVACYHVTRNIITVSPLPEVDDRVVRLFLFGSAIGALLQLNGILTLHGAAVRLRFGGAAVFCGASTAGKSTLAASLGHRAYPSLADDLVAIHFDGDGGAWVHPGLARFKLWGDAVARLNLVNELNERIHPDLDKYALAVKPWNQAEPLTYVYELIAQPDSEVTLSPISGLARIDLLMRHTYRPQFIGALGLIPDHCRRLGRVATQQQIKMRRLSRPEKGNTADKMITLLEQDWM